MKKIKEAIERLILQALHLTHTKPLLYPAVFLLLLLALAFCDPLLFNKDLLSKGA
ncbi:MAG: hypothetical protein Q9N68_08785 [Gammaproteobacteria bacterium]|nr:hypothetical protein [Gammaproteobacteria bacterium]